MIYAEKSLTYTTISRCGSRTNKKKVTPRLGHAESRVIREIENYVYDKRQTAEMTT